MNRALIFPLGLVFTLVSFKAIAQDQLKIGHVDVVEIVSSLPERDTAQVLLDKDTDELELMLEKMQVEYKIQTREWQKTTDEDGNPLPEPGPLKIFCSFVVRNYSIEEETKKETPFRVG